MARLASVLVALAALAGVWFLPEVSRARLACLEAGDLLNEPLPGQEGVPEDEQVRLWQAVLDGPAARAKEGGGIELALYGVRLGADEEARAEMTMNLLLRQSIVRGLRQYATDAYQPLEIVGEEAPSQTAGGANFYLQLVGDELALRYTAHESDDEAAVRIDWAAPRRTSVLPPLVAVALAVLFRRPLLALFCGVLAGAVLARQAAGAGLAASAGLGFVDVFRQFFWNELRDPERAMIVGFVLFMLAMVGVMTRSGGIRGLMDAVAGLARNARRTQIAAYFMGLAIFFDDYANTILVGSTMRPLTDRFRISREKLAYIVDSTAAPVAGLSIFSTWIAFEVSTFSAQLPTAGLGTDEGYSVFLQTVPYSFYCLLALVLVAVVTFTGRDVGPMLTAERRARRTGQLVREGAMPMVSEEATTLEPAAGVTPRASRAVVPLLVFIGVTLIAIFLNGAGHERLVSGELFTIEGATGVLYDGSGSEPLLIGSAAGLLVAVVAGLAAGLTTLLGAAWTTLRSMWIAFAILYLAWMIGAVCGALGTAPWLTAVVGESLDPRLLPTLLFVLAGVVAFATGSSWSTMSILLPLVVGLAYHLGVDAGLADTGVESGRFLMVISIAATLSGAIFGDHCSPISDTTVMSSIASASDHIDHVRTQAPYAFGTMAVAILTGYLPATYLELAPGWSLLLGAAVIAGFLLLRGRRVDAPD